MVTNIRSALENNDDLQLMDQFMMDLMKTKFMCLHQREIY